MAPHLHDHIHHHGNHPFHQALSYPYCCSYCTCNSSSFLPISTDQLFTQSFLKPQQTHSQPLLHDLIRRVSALESSLFKLSSHSPAILVSPSPTFPRKASSLSLREVAARTIQARFRRFLVRRSQTLRDLKRLASIKASASALYSLISKGLDTDPEALSQNAMDLLLQLDSIQSFDLMIRDGKRSISRELTRMLEFVDTVLMSDRRLAFPATEVMEAEGLQRPRLMNARRVSFAKNGSGVSEEDSNGVSRFLNDNLKFGNDVFFHGKNDGSGLSAPLPLQMEP